MGGGDIGAIKLAACHKPIKNAEKYKKDAKSQLAIHQSSKKKAGYVELVSNSVSMWKPIFLQDIQSAMILGNTLHVTPRPLDEVAHEYFEKCLGIKQDNRLIKNRQIQDVLRVALDHQPILDEEETLLSFTDSLDVSDRNKRLLYLQIERSTKAACEKAVRNALQAYQAE